MLIAPPMTMPSFFLILPALMAFAASYDCLTRRITNGLCLLVSAAFFVAAILAGLQPSAILMHCSCALVALAFTFVLYGKGWIGGGDAKLFAAGTLWFGWGSLASFAAVTAIAGGLLAASALMLQYLRAQYAPSCTEPIGQDFELPYGVAIACASLAIFPSSLWIHAPFA